MNNLELINTCNLLLDKGRRILNLDAGIVSHIYEDQYELVAVKDRNQVFIAGEVFPLMKTYCREVYERGQSIALTEIDGVWGLKNHPLYEALALEAYISSPIFFKNKVWGTINFSSMEPRKEAFIQEEIEFLEHCANLIADKLSI